MQKTLSNNENERRLLVERLERTERALNEVNLEYKSKTDHISMLQSELDAKEIQKAHLDDQLRFMKFSNSIVNDKEASFTIQKLQIECCELRGKIEMLEEKVKLYLICVPN